MAFTDYAVKAAGLIISAPRGAAYPRSVAATFELAIDAAAQACPAAETLMAYLAECGPERIPMSLVEGALDDETERAIALLALTEVSLVKADPFDDGTPGISVHRLVQAVDEGLVRQLGIRRLTLMGNSTGGRVVQVFAGLHPDMVDRVIVEDVGPERPQDISDNFVRQVNELDQQELSVPTGDFGPCRLVRQVKEFGS